MPFGGYDGSPGIAPTIAARRNRNGIVFAHSWLKSNFFPWEVYMADRTMPKSPTTGRLHQPDGVAVKTRQQLIDLLNEDLAREYQAIIAYVAYSQTAKGAAYMNIAQELEKHAAEELNHALIIAKQIDYLGGTPVVTPKPVRIAAETEANLRFDLENENETVRNYRDRVRQCEELGEYAIAEQIRGIIVNEQEHQIDLATALGRGVAEFTATEQGA